MPTNRNPRPPVGVGKNQTVLADLARKLSSKEGRHDELRDRTIEGWVAEAAAELADARVQIYVPLLVEHIVRQRITASAPQRATAQTG